MIIIEGIDGTGKTTLKNGLSLRGFCSQYFDYDTMTPDIFKKYCGAISAGNEKSVLERSFISEVVYGTCIRKHSRISSYQFDKLASMCAEKYTVVIYLYATKEVLLSRKQKDFEDWEKLKQYYLLLNNEYEITIRRLSHFLPVLYLNATRTPNELIEDVCNFYKEKYFDLVCAGNISRDRHGDFKSDHWGGSGFHKAIASALFGKVKIGVISGVGRDFDESIFNLLNIENICGKKTNEDCIVFYKNPQNSIFELISAKYIDFPPVSQRIFSRHLHISLRRGVAAQEILNNPMIRYTSLSVDVIFSSLDFAIDIIRCLSGKFLIVPYKETITRTDGAGDNFIGGTLSTPPEEGNSLRDSIIYGIALA